MVAIAFEDVEDVLRSGGLETGKIRTEFKCLDMGDEHLNRRLAETADLLGRSPPSPINEACQNWTKTKGAYRLFDNDKFTVDALLDSHRLVVAERIKRHEVILCAQDTVFFTYDNHPKTTGLGPVVKSKESGGSRGLLMHHAMAFTTSGVPLGILSQNIFARKEVLDETMKEKVLRVKYLPTEEKESAKWLFALRDSVHAVPTGTHIITVADRECDFFEFIEEEPVTTYNTPPLDVLNEW